MIPRFSQAEARARAEAAHIEIQAKLEAAKLEAQVQTRLHETRQWMSSFAAMHLSQDSMWYRRTTLNMLDTCCVLQARKILAESQLDEDKLKREAELEFQRKYDRHSMFSPQS